jgi:hypothetical protein
MKPKPIKTMLNLLRKVNLEHLDEFLRKLEENKCLHDYWKYLTLDGDVFVALSFKIYYTLIHGSWPKDLDEDYFKITWHEVKKDEHKG